MSTAIRTRVPTADETAVLEHLQVNRPGLVLSVKEDDGSTTTFSPASNLHKALKTELDTELVKISKPPMKRQRLFHVDRRAVPSRLGAWFGGTPSDWELYATYSKLADAKRAQHAFTVLANSWYIKGRTEYRVRCTNKKVV